MADSLAAQAFAPIDYSGYGKVAESMVGAGKGINTALEDFATYEKEKDKERLRMQAVQEMKANPETAVLFKENGGPWDDNVSAEEIGKGLRNLGIGTLLYDQLAATKDPNLHLPDKNQFKQTLVKASPGSVDKLQVDWQKRIDETTKGAQSQTQLKTYGDLQAQHPDWTQEQLNAEAARQGLSPEQLGPQGTTISQSMAPKEMQIQKQTMAEKRFRLDERRAGAYIDKVGSDKFYADLGKTQGVLSAYERALKGKDDAQLKVSNMINNKDAKKTEIENKGGVFNESEYDAQVKSAQKIVNDREGILKGILRNAKSATREFNQRYQGALEFDPELESELGGSGIGAGESSELDQKARSAYDAQYGAGAYDKQTPEKKKLIQARIQ